MKRGLLIALLVLLPMGARAAIPGVLKDSDCLDCHGDNTLTITNAGKVISLYVDVARLHASVHATNSCASCHNDLTSKHPDDNIPARPVNCARCHQSASLTYLAGAHGLAAKEGERKVPTCIDCHDTHEAMRPESPASPLYFANLAQTCGRCHAKEAADVEQSVHGKAAAQGHRDAPTCTDCHDEHKLESLRQQSPLEIAQGVCSKCHASVELSAKYRMPADRVRTFLESYHGLAAERGSSVVANCASCHGYHKILPSTDSESTINPAHLVQTCGQCHPGADAQFAETKVHVDVSYTREARDIGSKVNFWVRRVYLVLIFGVVGAMSLHNGALFVRKCAARARLHPRDILRMDGPQRLQHGILAVSFIVLAWTGFALKYPDAWIGRFLISNEAVRAWTHRIAGVILIGAGIWHVVYVLTTGGGRRLIRDMMPAAKDARDAAAMAKYLAGRRRSRPAIGRFGYAEKMEYWAVVWGTILMGGTGLAIWCKIFVTHWLPGWVIEVATSVHYYEALLACLAIVVWHFYHVIFDPDVYPFNRACLDGRVSVEWLEEEHSLEVPVSQTVK